MQVVSTLLESVCTLDSILLTALDLQGAVLLIQWVSAQVHHTGSCRGDP